MIRKLLSIAVFSLSVLALAAPSQAQHRGGSAPARGSATVRGGGGGGGTVVAPRPVYRGGYGYGYRGYYYPRYSFGFYGGWPYYYSPYYYPYGYYGYGYPYYGGAYYGDSRVARGLGSLQIKDAPKSAQVFADGYYAGNVDDFDGVFQHLDLEAGEHHIEIRPEGQQPIAFDVKIEPGETITYHAEHR